MKIGINVHDGKSLSIHKMGYNFDLQLMVYGLMYHLKSYKCGQSEVDLN